jgi:hypothetical protein
MSRGRGQRAESREQRAEGRGQRAESREQRAEGRGQRAESRGQRAEGRGQRAESKLYCMSLSYGFGWYRTDMPMRQLRHISNPDYHADE